MQRRLLACAASLGSLVLVSGCFLIVPEPHDDMRARLDSLEIPSDFAPGGSGGGGLRSGFAGASHPHVDRWYAAPWDDGGLCDRLAALADSVAKDAVRAPQPPDDGGGVCRIQATLGAGWRGRLLGISSYRLSLLAVSREVARRHTTDARCRDQLRRAGPGADAVKSRTSPCWLEPGEAVVTITLTGPQSR